MIKKIAIEDALKKTDCLWIDARSPNEYEEDHILDAINLPLLDNEERHEVGVIYKQISREKAIEKGMEYYAKKIPNIYEAVKEYREKEIIIYCARGGMRSGIIASLLDSIGFTVFQVEGGYKLFRNYMVKTFNQYDLKPKVVVLWGLTCTGKTDLLKNFPNSLDLEGLAQHRGSLMGALGLKPNSQKKFENLLLKRLDELQKENVILIEGESRRIGDVIIPEFLYKKMLGGTQILITRDLKERAKAMVKEYFIKEHLEEIKTIVTSFNRLISNKRKTDFVRLVDEKKYEEAATIILTEYYDPLYQHTLKNFTYSFMINNDLISQGVKEIKKVLLQFTKIS